MYNKNSLPQYVNTAGKITIVTTFSGVAIFLLVFLLNIGSNELQKVQAQATSTATTTLTVLNTPPEWVAAFEGREEFESSTTSPTNSFSTASWIGTATDANSQPYFLLICEDSAEPTPNASENISVTNDNLGTAPPECPTGTTQWAVSEATASGVEARAATTTLEAAPFGTVNEWYAWVCDDDSVNPRCNSVSFQGTNSDNSSPFYVNPRPTLTSFTNDGPVDPGATITFSSVSTDTYTPLDADIFLVICSTNSYSTTTNDCGADTLATTSGSIKDNATAELVIDIPTQDNTYDAFAFLYDQFGHSADGGQHGANDPFEVANVAPFLLPGDITLNNGLDLLLSVPAGETENFLLSFTISDNNSCEADGGGPEITDYVASVFRSGVGTTTCDGSAGAYDPNNCYPSGVPDTVWNLNCTASTTSCTGPQDDSILYECEFPLWFIADPTFGGPTDTPFSGENWVAAIAGIDDNTALGSTTIGGTGVDLQSLVAIDLQTAEILYSDLEPGDTMPSLTASSSIRAIGNTGLNQLLGGDDMCEGYSPSNPCPVSASTTIPADQQRYATSSVNYGDGFVLQGTTSPALFEIEIPKPTSTSTPIIGTTYWGIAVPGTIEIAGVYTGQNIFIGDVSAPAAWSN